MVFCPPTVRSQSLRTWAGSSLKLGGISSQSLPCKQVLTKGTGMWRRTAERKESSIENPEGTSLASVLAKGPTMKLTI